MLSESSKNSSKKEDKKKILVSDFVNSNLTCGLIYDYEFPVDFVDLN